MKELNGKESEPTWLSSAFTFLFEGVKDHLKGVIGTAIVGGFVAAGLYIWSGQAAWLLPIALYLVSFIIGAVITLAFLGFIGFRSVLQTRRQAATFAAGLVSQDKGFFDYFVELEDLQPQFTETIATIGNEMGNMAQVTGEIDFVALTAQGSRAVVEGLGKAARRLIKHSDIMSAEQPKLESLLSRMTEATGHQVQSRFIDVNTLPPVRTALIELRDHSEATRNAMTNWRTAQQNVYGMSQEMNTAVNHMLAITDRILGTLRASEERWTEQLGVVDARLLKPAE